MSSATSPQFSDTIAAIATPPGQGGVGIVRVSGQLVPQISRAIIGFLPSPRSARFSLFRDSAGAVVDEGIVLYFMAPQSFTGEDVIEFQGHGGPLVMDRLLRATIDAGARVARPGEFSERAFLNGKIDLVKAEAVADLIEAGSDESARAAMRSLTGEFSREVNAINESLVELRTYVESAIDFPEEEIDFLAEGDVEQRLSSVIERLDGLFSRCHQGRLLRDGITVVLAGAPNAGKSSLMNVLARQDTAIVSDVPGTTRDVLREHVVLNQLPVHLVDTAGLRESDDVIETEGVRRARAAMQQADHVLLLVDDSDQGRTPDIGVTTNDVPVTRVLNKIDITGREAGPCGQDCFAISVRTSAGIEQLVKHVEESAGYLPEATGSYSARRRHLEALKVAREHMISGQRQLKASRAGELLADDLLQAQKALGEITGEFTSDDLLGKIFSSFCIGK